MPTFEWQALFDQEWRSLTAEQQRAFRDAVAAFVEDLHEGTGFRKGLRMKKMQGREDVWEMSWGTRWQGDLPLRRPGGRGRGAHRLAPDRDA